jgi:hypothetical protein
LEEELREAEIIIDVQKNFPCCWVARCFRCWERELLMSAAEELSSMVGVRRACQELSVPRVGRVPAPQAPSFSLACGRGAEFGAPFEGF